MHTVHVEMHKSKKPSKNGRNVLPVVITIATVGGRVSRRVRKRAVALAHSRGGPE